MRTQRPIFEKIGNSLAGLRAGWHQDRAVRNHVLFSGIALIALLVARPPLAWVLASLTLLVAGLAAELVNGAVEVLLDRLHPDRHPAIGAAKDMASAAPFIINVAAAVVVLCALLSSLAPANS